MKLRNLALVFLVGLGTSLFSDESPAQQPVVSTPVEYYLNLLKKGEVDPHLLRFSQSCTVRPEDAPPQFAFSNDEAGTWKAVRDLPAAFESLEMDLIGMAQVWKTRRGVLIESWNIVLDVGGFQRTLNCFDATGHLVAEDTTNYQTPDDGPVWGMHERWQKQPNGEWRAVVPFEFIGMDDKPISEPKLDADYRAFAASWGRKPPSDVMIDDLKIPRAILH
jgi:hypothetical protein